MKKTLSKAKKKAILLRLHQHAAKNPVRNSSVERLPISMNTPFNHLFESLQQIALPDEKKKVILHALLRHTKHPHTSRLRTTILHWKSMIAVCTSLLVFITSGGAMAYMTDDTLPGDSLYRVKVDIGEEIVSYVSFMPSWKAHWEIKRAEDRLHETIRLTEQNELNQEKLTEILEYIDTHTDIVNSIAANMGMDGNEDDALDIAGELESVLRSYRSILSTLQNNNPTEKEIIAKLLTHLHSVESDTKDLRDILEDIERGLIADNPSYVTTEIEQSMHNAEEVSIEYYENRQSFSEKMTTLLEERIQLIFTTVESAEHLQKSGNTIDAFAVVKTADQLLAETRAFLAIGSQMQTDTNTLQKEEVQNTLTQAQEEVTHISNVIAALPDDETIIELRIRMQLAEQLLTEAENQFAADNFSASNVLSSEVLQIIESIEMLEESL